MKSKSAKRLTSAIIAVFILSNSIFIYADERALLDHYSSVSTTKDKSREHKPKTNHNTTHNKQSTQNTNLNGHNNQSTHNTDLDRHNNQSIHNTDLDGHNNIKKSQDSTHTNHDTLDILNMNYNEYKHELKKGESLHTLLEKTNTSEQYGLYKYAEYTAILENAVNNNAITKEEMNALLANYVKSIEAITT